MSKTIGKHINNVFKEGELGKEVVVANFATTTQHGAIKGKTQSTITEHYNLDVILVASLKDLGKRWFAFSKMEKNSVKNILNSIFELI